jgi:hypothetical protein
LKQEFNPKDDWFSNVSVWIDLGYLGFAKNYKIKELHIPYKKPRKSKNNPNPKLEDWQKTKNKLISQFRIFVENAIGGIKRYNILNCVFRNKKEEIRDKSIYLAAGLWNFKINAKI